MKKYLSNENIDSFIKYKYQSEENSFLTRKYKVFWEFIQKFIPKYIHPNIITLLGLLSVIFGYYMMKTYSLNKVMGICVWLYMNFDAIDGIHARNTKNTSVIGEYLDHIIDLINTGFILDCITGQLGFNSKISNMFTTTVSFAYILPHYESIINGKIKFEGLTDVSLILTLTTIFFISGLRLPEFIINNNYLIYGFIILLNIYNIIKLKKTVSEGYIVNNINLAMTILIWYIIKFIGIIINPTNYTWTLTIIDTILLFELINYKIFKKRSYKALFVLPGIFSLYPLVFSSLVINYLLNTLNKIATELKINIFKVEDKKLRVFCCGVFDMCHLGHMMLFKKIHDSFDEPIKLIVGVHSDEVCASYKRDPIINEKLRYRTVELCKYVDEIFEDCPLVVTKELIEKGKYDVVIIGEEYKDNKDVDWYPGAFELNNHKYISRFTEISTSDIIKKVKLL